MDSALEVRKSLPQLDPLIAFEAAARHASFARAARELNVTASAISQQIRSLESQLGVALFERGHRSVQLTGRGRDFQNSVSLALMHLMNAASEARASDTGSHLELATDTSIAATWLMPRLERFAALEPGVSLKLTVTDTQSELLNSPFQVAVMHGDGRWRGFDHERLFEEEVFPVCAPQYLATWHGALCDRDLPKAALLDLEYEHWRWMNWAIWLTEMGLPLPETPRKLRSNNYPVILEAARRGLGMALGWRHLVDDELEAGTLVRPVTRSVTTRYAYYVVWPFNEELSPIARRFRDWLLGECDKQASGRIHETLPGP